MGMERYHLQSGTRLEEGRSDHTGTDDRVMFRGGDLRALFDGKELRLMLFNFREAGLIPKQESM